MQSNFSVMQKLAKAKGGATGYAGYAMAYPDFSKLSHRNATKSKLWF